MANVNIKFNGKEFLLSCDDGQEAHLEELSEQLNQKFENLKKNLGNIGENKLLLITSIKIIDEYFENLDPIFAKIRECISGSSIDNLLDGPVCHDGFRRLN